MATDFFREVEERWQRRWGEDGTYRVDLDDHGLLLRAVHVPLPERACPPGRVRNYTFGDVIGRAPNRMQGHAVLSPFGFDSFGLAGQKTPP